jgi:carbon-monoxide dehydrogenase small subunit
MNERTFQFTVNGQNHSVHVPPMSRLIDVLRHELELTGTKEGCGEGECGSCSVLMDGLLVNSCLVPIAQAAGSHVITIEGIGSSEKLHPLQRAFLECGGAQCGICTPGMILASLHLLKKHPNPTMDQIREGLNGNLCRCTGYVRIFESVAKAATMMLNTEVEHQVSE